MIAKRTFLLVILMLLTSCFRSRIQPVAVEDVKPDWDEYFQGFEGASVVYDLNEDRYIRYNPEGSAKRLLPASTFKIMNALIALDTEVIPDGNYVIPWDGTHYEIQSWNQDHTLKSAFQNSVVWYYQEVARRIGRERMQQYIDAVGYGNQNSTGNLDSFWLDGTLRISANEQVEFLKRLYKNDLPFSQRSMDIVKEIMILQSDVDYLLRGKTGTGFIESQHIGWFVGYQETSATVLIFATNITSSSSEATGTKAKEISITILQELRKDKK